MHTELVLFALAIFLGTFIQNSIGFGAGVPTMAILPFFFPLDFLMPVLIILFFLNTLFFVIREIKHVNLSFFRYIIPGSIIGILTGTYFLSNLDDLILKKIVGIVLIFLGCYFIFIKDKEFKSKLNIKWGFFFGLASGLLANFSMSNIPIILFGKLSNFSKKAFYTSIGSFLFFSNFFVIISFWLYGLFSAEKLIFSVYFFPFVFLGIILGKKFYKIIPEKTFQNVISVFLTISGTLLLLK